MPKAAITLSDDQARLLLQRLPDILERHPAGARTLRPFADEFVAAVHAATGRVFSPAIYRRWLPTYAPGRMPSSDTLAAAARAFEEESKAFRPEHAVDPSAPIDRSVIEHIVSITARQVVQAFDAARRQGDAADRRAQQQIEQLQAQLVASEQRTNEARVLAARLAGDLQAARAANEQLQAEVHAGRAALEQLNKSIDAVMREMAELRKVTMTAIDGVRGETRAWQERCKSVEGQLQQSRQHLEVFRQLAYRRGADIPAEILKEDVK